MIYTVKKVDEFSNSKLEHVYSLLNPKQKEYLDRKPSEKRIQSLCARAALSEMLGDEILSQISSDEYGRINSLSDGRFISISHSGSYVAVACSKRPVGIDIQEKRTVSERLINRVCSENERIYIRENGVSSFFEIWTAKEAYVKCFGVSFFDTSKVSFIKDGKIAVDDADCMCFLSAEYYCFIMISKEKR